jgi:glucokinase
MMSRTSAKALPWLVADVGGTNARFGLVRSHGAMPDSITTLPVAEYGSLTEALRHYLRAQGATPQHAAIAVATPVTRDDAVRFTNSHWSFSRAEVKATLGLETFIVLNDFEALALSLPRLTASQVESIRGMPRAEKTLAVVGPGTGLGVGGVIATRAGWVAIPGEGGHASVAPFDDFEAQLLQYLRRSWSHISGERLLSGIGLPTLYEAVGAVMGTPISAPLKGKQIVEAGLARTDPIAERTLDQFCAMLGGFCGSTVLTLGAFSGLYLGGGIVPRLGERLSQSQFLTRFEAKGRFQPLLSSVPIALITDTLSALSGAALAIEQSEMAA